MSQAQAAAGMDRLPWLPDEPNPAPTKRGRNRDAAALAGIAMLFVAAASYWMGAHSWDQPSKPREAARPSTTVPLPQPRGAVESQPQVVFEPAPVVRPAPQRDVRIASPRVERLSARRPAAAVRVPQRQPVRTEPFDHGPPAPAATASAPASNPAPAASDKPLTAWPAWQSKGAYGRIVRIGAFGSRQQAKLGWRHMVRAYPAVAHLQAIVVEVRNSRGRPFYRFQIGTTSQAHSEILCQRMERIRLSCAVVGLPWKPKGVER